MKKEKACRLLLLTLIVLVLCTACAGCAAKNAAPVSSVTSKINAAAGGDDPIVNYGAAVNIVIFICFSDESPNAIRSSIPSDFESRCNGDDNSIKDYYHDLSYGQFSFTSIFPVYNDGRFFIYQDEHTRSFYTSNKSESGVNRTSPESDLLNNAIYEASLYLDLSGANLDMNKDGFVDCVTFLISGDYQEKAWNTIMWPHSWQLNDITREATRNTRSSASLGGKRVNDYTFLFLGSVASRVGLMCHELGHAVGNLPDLYHYNSGQSQYLPVGYWDLMHLDCTVPQYVTTYLRWKYLSFANENQIVEMSKSGDYTLVPTTVAGPNQTLAYKLTIDNGTNTPNESIWIEYRRKDVTTYDSELPGSGLVVYRINTKAKEGNKNARHEDVSNPDEVYVYRPDFSSKVGLSDKEKDNLSRAYVSLNNPYFSSLGDANSTKKYDPNCIYLTNGKNTGIVINIISETQDEVTFHIELGDYDGSEIDFKNSFVMGNTGNKKEVVINYGEELKSQINLYIKRKNRGLYRADDNDITLLGGDDLYKVCEEGKDAYIEYRDDYGVHQFSYRLTIHDKLKSRAGTVLTTPNKTIYAIGDTFYLDGLTMLAEYSSGNKTIAYSPESSAAWQVIGFDSTKSGEQDITAIYNDDIRVHFTVTVHCDLTSIYVSEKNTRHIQGDTIREHYNVIAVYEDGMKRELKLNEYTIEHDTEMEYVRAGVTIRAKENEAIYCTTYFYHIPQRMTSISLTADPKRTYNYGEALDLSAGRIQVSFGDFSLDGENALPLENYYFYFSGYDPTKPTNEKITKQSLRVNIEDASFTLDVNVKPLPDTLISIKRDENEKDTDVGIRLIDSAEMMLLDKDYTLGELAQKIGSYLNITFRYTVGRDEFTVSPETYGTLPLYSEVSVVLTNTEGVVIKTYKIYRSGDGNDDGVVNDSDVIYWKKAIIRKKDADKYTSIFDKNNDNSYTLTDYVLLMDGLQKEAE